MKLTISVDSDNAGCQTVLDAQYLLEQAKEKLQDLDSSSTYRFPLRDINGNKVGYVQYEGTEEE